MTWGCEGSGGDGVRCTHRAQHPGAHQGTIPAARRRRALVAGASQPRDEAEPPWQPSWTDVLNNLGTGSYAVRQPARPNGQIGLVEGR